MKHLAYGAAVTLTAVGLAVGTARAADTPVATAPITNLPQPAQAVTPTNPPALAASPVCPPVHRQAAATHHYRARVHHGSQYSSVRSYSSYVREVEVPVPTPVYYQPPPPTATPCGSDFLHGCSRSRAVVLPSWLARPVGTSLVVGASWESIWPAILAGQ